MAREGKSLPAKWGEKGCKSVFPRLEVKSKLLFTSLFERVKGEAMEPRASTVFFSARSLCQLDCLYERPPPFSAPLGRDPRQEEEEEGKEPRSFATLLHFQVSRDG